MEEIINYAKELKTTNNKEEVKGKIINKIKQLAPLSFMNFSTLYGLHTLCHLDDDILDYCKLCYNELDSYQCSTITLKIDTLFDEIIELRKMNVITQHSIDHCLSRVNTKEKLETLISVGADPKSNDN